MSTRRTRKVSEFGRQLREKQDLKKIYGLREVQFKRIVDAAKKMPGNAADNILILLERRLDNAVFRLGFARTRPQARQYVAHGLFLLNAKRVDIPSILVKQGDKIKPRKIELFKKGTVKPRADWLCIDTKDLEGKVLNLPSRDQIDTPINENLVLQFYSR